MYARNGRQVRAMGVDWGVIGVDRWVGAGLGCRLGTYVLVENLMEVVEVGAAASVGSPLEVAG